MCNNHGLEASHVSTIRLGDASYDVARKFSAVKRRVSIAREALLEQNCGTAATRREAILERPEVGAP